MLARYIISCSLRYLRRGIGWYGWVVSSTRHSHPEIALLSRDNFKAFCGFEMNKAFTMLLVQYIVLLLRWRNNMMGGGPARTYVFLDYSSAPNAISSPGSEDRASRKKLPGHFRGKKRRSRKILHWKHLPPTSVSSFRSSFPSSYIENNMKKTRGERKWASSSAKFLETAFSNLAMICGRDKWLKSANVQLRARQRRFWICRHPPYCCSMCHIFLPSLRLVSIFYESDCFIRHFYLTLLTWI